MARDLLQMMRDGAELAPQFLHSFARDLGAGKVSDAQAGAFAMAACLNGLSDDARVALTLGMRDSGQVLSWDLPGKVIDKHSTGGVGDAVSLLLAPMLAAAGVFVPMLSGRGLGHTGGTLDKLEAIPGVRTNLGEPRLRKIVRDIGCVIAAPTDNIAPADKRLYATRDVTGTVRSIDLITSSILSKKLAAGLEALVLDVKFGQGAVMQNLEDARALAQALVATANGAGCPTTALVTDMNQPLLPSIGNAVEVADVMRSFATAKGRLVEVAIALGADLLHTSKVVYTEIGARDLLQTTLKDGSALTKFGAMIAAQGGPENFADRWEDYLSIAPGTDVVANMGGYVSEIDGTALGHIVVGLGGGRQREDDKIDHSVGLSEILPLGQKVKKGTVLARVHCHDPELTGFACDAVAKAITLSDSAPIIGPLVVERVSG